MSATITTATLTAQPTASGRFTIPPNQLATTLDEFLPALWGYLIAQGVTPDGPPFTRYWGMSETTFDLEVGLPIPGIFTPNERFSGSALPAGTALTMVHVGPYDQLGAAYDLLAAWAAEHHLSLGPAPWEVYLTDPSEVTDPGQWQTAVIWPLAD